MTCGLDQLATVSTRRSTSTRSQLMGAEIDLVSRSEAALRRTRHRTITRDSSIDRHGASSNQLSAQYAIYGYGVDAPGAAGAPGSLLLLGLL
jgi:hypothetical protein